MSIEPAPIALDPTGDFLGNDGAWSTFSISAGSPPQQLQVLVSTQVQSTWVIAPSGCDLDDAANCTDTRGGAYDATKSSSWNDKSAYGLGDEKDLGYNSNDLVGEYGYDQLGIQAKGANITVDHQVIAAIATKRFYVGNLGLSPSPINFTAEAGSTADSSPSLLSSLKTQNRIPSLSYGYTAGAYYQQKDGVSGSLTLGGYDASRLIPNDVSMNFGKTFNEQLQIGLRSITHSNSTTETPLLSDGILALVDSTVPYLWLPQSICVAFEDAFGLVWDELRSLYLVNDTLHGNLLKQNASVIFEVANGLTGGPSTNITLPYASFDLEVSAPLVKSQSRYFPLQRSNDDNKGTLGRTFFQEAFLIVDYEHSNFSVSQAVFDPNAPSHIVSIIADATPTTPGGTDSNPTATNGPILKTTTHSGSHGIGIGAIAGIAIAIVLLASLCGAFFIRRSIRRRRALKKITEPETGETKEMPFDEDRDSKQDFFDDLEVKKSVAATVTVNEVPMTPPSATVEADDTYFSPMGKARPQTFVQELPGSPGNRSELSSPEPWSRSELPSPDPDEIRSELSTPEPMWNHPELPSPDPSHELESPGISSISSGQPSPPMYDNRQSRPQSDRMDSSESEAGWTRDGMPQRPFHRRLHSDDSDLPSSDSEASNPFVRVDDSSESEPTVSPIIARRPVNRNDSSDSDSAISSPSYPPRPRAPFRRTDSSASESESPSPRPTSNTHHIRGLTTPFHSSSSSRPAIRRSIHAVVGSLTSRHSGSPDGKAWLDSASTENSSHVSRFPSSRQARAVNGTRDESLSEEDEDERLQGSR